MKQELNKEGQPPTEVTQISEWRRRLQDKEEKAWREVLGIHVATLSLPYYLTPQSETRLKSFGLELRFFPPLDLSLINLQALDIQGYLDQLACRYPNWRPFETLTEREKGSSSIFRNLARDFWESVKKEEIQLPPFSGYWLAAETVLKPNYTRRYQETLLMQRLRIFNRFALNPVLLNERVRRERASILETLSLPLNTDIRLLEAIEWNLLGNREGWGKTTSYEWTNTTSRTTTGELKQIIIGGKDLGGVTSFSILPLDQSYDMVGFRLSFVLKG